jgi:hypothetical protein
MDWFDHGSTNWEEIMVPIFDHDYPKAVFQGGNNGMDGYRNHRMAMPYSRNSRRTEKDFTPDPLDFDLWTPDMKPSWECSSEMELDDAEHGVDWWWRHEISFNEESLEARDWVPVVSYPKYLDYIYKSMSFL